MSHIGYELQDIITSQLLQTTVAPQVHITHDLCLSPHKVYVWHYCGPNPTLSLHQTYIYKKPITKNAHNQALIRKALIRIPPKLLQGHSKSLITHTHSAHQRSTPYHQNPSRTSNWTLCQPRTTSTLEICKIWSDSKPEFLSFQQVL